MIIVLWWEVELMSVEANEVMSALLISEKDLDKREGDVEEEVGEGCGKALGGID